MALRHQHRLLAHMRHASYEPADIDTLADQLGVEEEEREAFRAAVDQLAAKGELVLGDANTVHLPPIGDEVVGSFKRHPKGFGFIIPETKNPHGDLFVPAPNTADAVTGDRVRAEVVRRKGRGKPSESPYVGNIVEILERAQTSFSGELVKRGGRWMVEPDGSIVTDPVIVADAESKNAKEGDKVVFEITQYPEGDYLGEGVIVKVLGESGEPNVETAAVIEAYNLPGEFPPEAFSEARELSAAFTERMEREREGEAFDPAERLDLRDTFVLTIDPPDAKDYDDALSIEKLDSVAGGGPGWRLGVHIADVSNFVTPGTFLDEEGGARANSVYLPRLVIPMLPEILSNGICSLQEGVGRFCKSVFIDYDRQGNVRGKGFSATLIHSRKRLTYLEAQALIDGDEEEAKKHARTEPGYTPELVSKLREMNTLSRAIRERRKRAGMIHLDLPEVELIFDDDGRVVDAVPEDDAYTHTLIEMFMVEANEAVARLFEELEAPLIRRIHPDPVPANMEQLRDYVKVAGFRIPKQPSREELQGLLDATKGTPAAPAIHFAVLRTLTKAEYSPALIGHFALASQAYAHFTSPIRRYADLTVHRSLTKYLELTRNGEDPPRSDKDKIKLGKRLKETAECPDEQALLRVCGVCNRNEERATGAERELRQFLVLQLLAEHIGGSFPGIVTGVSNAGVFVRLDKYLAEGLVKTEDLPDPNQMGKGGGGGGGGPKTGFKRAFWRLDKRSGSLLEQNSGRSFSMGDRVEVTVLEVDLPRRQMNLGITDPGSRAAGKSKTPESVAAGLRLGDVIEEAKSKQKTGAQKRAQRSKSRDKRKGDHRQEKKQKGKRQ